MYYSECMALNAEIERLKAENERLTERLKKVLLSIDTVKEMNAICNIDDHRKQAVKEFAEKCMDGVGYGSDERIIKKYLDEFIKEYEQ